MAFHAHSGWFFERLGDGSVSVIRRRSGFGCGYPEGEPLPARKPRFVEVIFDPDAWASIVASVSKRGETAATFIAAHDFHQRDA